MTKTETDIIKKNPRRNIIEAVKKDDRISCLLKTAEIHGHFCPGSAMGVMASLYALRSGSLSCLELTDGMENLLAIVEINACFADGVQTVTGCTFGNNALIYRDMGKHALTLATRDSGRGIRVVVKPDFQSVIAGLVPEFYPLMNKVIKERAGNDEDEKLFKEKGCEAAFAVLELRFEDLFLMEESCPQLPEYAPITESIICPVCNESAMITKAELNSDNEYICLSCAKKSVPCLDGKGITINTKI